MVDSAFAPEVIIWTDPHRAAMVSRILDLLGAGVRAIGVGGPRSAELDDLARRLDCPQDDDFRKLLIDRPSAFVLLATMSRIAPDDLIAAIEQRSIVLCLDPPAADFDDLSPFRGKHAGTGRQQRLIYLPAFMDCHGWLSAADPVEVLGDPQMVSYASMGRRGECSLFARLYDGWRTILACLDMPVAVSASLSGGNGDVPDDARAITGYIGAHARLPNGATALLQASDAASRVTRWVNALSAQGQLYVDDLSYELFGPDGRMIDQAQAATGSRDLADLAAAVWTRLLDRTENPPAQGSLDRDMQTLACCRATLLSARTGEPENPRRLLELAAT